MAVISLSISDGERWPASPLPTGSSSAAGHRANPWPLNRPLASDGDQRMVGL